MHMDPDWQPDAADRMVLAILALRFSEGDSVTILCANPDPMMAQENEAVLVCGGWTDWKEVRVQGETLLEALEKAANMRRISEGGGDPEPSGDLSPRPLARR